MHIPLPTAASECGWVSETDCFMVLKNGDIHSYQVFPLELGRDFQNGRYEGGSIWEGGIEYEGGSTAFALSPSGSKEGMIAYNSWLFPISTTAVGSEIDLRSNVTALAYSSRGDLAVGSFEGNVSILTEDASQLKKYYAAVHASSITAMAWSPDGENLVTGDDGGTVEYLNVWSGARIFSKRVSRRSIGHLACMDQKTFLVVEHGIRKGHPYEQMSCFTVDTKRATWQRKIAGFTAFAFAPTEQLIAVGDTEGMLHLWKPNDERFRPRVLQEHQMLSPKGEVQAKFEVTCLAFSPSARFLLSCASDGFAHITPLALPRRPHHDDGEAN